MNMSRAVRVQDRYVHLKENRMFLNFYGFKTKTNPNSEGIQKWTMSDEHMAVKAIDRPIKVTEIKAAEDMEKMYNDVKDESEIIVQSRSNDGHSFMG